MSNVCLGFIGAGKMASALARGFIEAKLTTADSIVAYDPVAASGEAFKKTTGAKLLESNKAVVAASDVVRSPRVGVDYAGAWALRLWRLSLRAHPSVSRPVPTRAARRRAARA